MTIRERSDIVLVVDDSPDTVRFLTEVLDARDKAVTIALDGPTALRIAARLRPNIVLMDAVMPEMDGFECCRRLKALSGFEDVPVIFMTGLGAPGDVVRGFGVGGADYVTKPIDIDAMLARIEVHLSNAQKIQRARMALDATDHFFIATSTGGRIIWFTPRAYRLLQQHFDNGAGELRLPAETAVWTREIRDSQDQSPQRLSFSAAGLTIEFVRRTDRDELLFRILRQTPLSRREDIALQYHLSRREVEVLTWLAKGKSNKDIAAILDLSPRTVDKHIQSIFAKMNVENRTAAAAISLGF